MNTALSNYGQGRQTGWLIYNPIQMYAYHRLAKRAAAPAIAAIDEIAPEARSIVDVGAGSGAFAAEAVRRGKRVRACEHSRAGRLGARCQGVNSVRFDLGATPPARLEGPFDLAYCFEVAEHLPPDLGDRLVEYLCGLAPLVVFSAAQPGQGGLAHINEQPPDYWRERFRGQGFEHCADLTAGYRQAAHRRGGRETWLLSNTMVFQPRAAR